MAVLLLFPDNDGGKGVKGVKGAEVLFPAGLPRLSLAPHEAEGAASEREGQRGEVGMVVLREAGQ